MKAFIGRLMWSGAERFDTVIAISAGLVNSRARTRLSSSVQCEKENNIVDYL